MRRLSLSQRLALVFTSLLLLCAAAVCVVQLYSSAQYGNAMVSVFRSGWHSRLLPVNRCSMRGARSIARR